MSLPWRFDDGWEVALLAATSPNRRVEGVTRANKLLARLQREGFPVTLEFENWPMGPASADLLPRARRAESKERLKVVEVNLRKVGIDDRVDFVLTEEGLEYVQKVIIPAIRQHPKGGLLTRVFRRALEPRGLKTTRQLVHESHEELYLDSRPQLFSAYNETRQKLETRYEGLPGGRPRDSFSLTVGATLELACDALRAIQEPLEDPHNKSTGKNHILAICEDLVDVLDEMDQLSALKLAKDVEEDIERVLNALEVNCEVYGIVPIMTDQEVENLMAEVPPLDPRTGLD